MVSVHPADSDEQIEAYRNAHETWGGGAEREAWVERRLESHRHNRAEWWVLTTDGEVAASLGRYPLQFRLDDELVEGFGVGAVHTRPAHRGRGYATRLVRQLHEARRAAGDTLALLFSDIRPNFYRRLGYAVCADRRFDTDELRTIAQGGERCSLQPLDAAARRDELAEWYRLAHADDALWLARDDDYWESTLRENPDDRFFEVRDAAGVGSGYIRCGKNGERLDLFEVALPGADEPLAVACYRALADLAVAGGAQRLHQSFPPPGPLIGRFDDNRRDDEITMIARLDPDRSLSEPWLKEHARIWLSDHF
jgi:predicted N-acetyltransferase YhbS